MFKLPVRLEFNSPAKGSTPSHWTYTLPFVASDSSHPKDQEDTYWRNWKARMVSWSKERGYHLVDVSNLHLVPVNKNLKFVEILFSDKTRLVMSADTGVVLLKPRSGDTRLIGGNAVQASRLKSGDVLVTGSYSHLSRSNPAEVNLQVVKVKPSYLAEEDRVLTFYSEKDSPVFVGSTGVLVYPFNEELI